MNRGFFRNLTYNYHHASHCFLSHNADAACCCVFGKREFCHKPADLTLRKWDQQGPLHEERLHPPFSF